MRVIGPGRGTLSVLGHGCRSSLWQELKKPRLVAYFPALDLDVVILRPVTKKTGTGGDRKTSESSINWTSPKSFLVLHQSTRITHERGHAQYLVFVLELKNL